MERSEPEGSYRGELPEMLTIHLFLLAAEEHCDTVGDSPAIFCDNKGTILGTEAQDPLVISKGGDSILLYSFKHGYLAKR